MDARFSRTGSQKILFKLPGYQAHYLDLEADPEEKTERKLEDSPEAAAATIRMMNDYVRWKARPKRVVKLFPVNRRKVEKIVNRHLRLHRREIGEMEAKEILEAYGFVTPKGFIATTADQAASYAEQVHASAHLRVLEGIGSTSDNLSEAADGEKFEVDEMYPAYMAVADDQNEDSAQSSFNYAYKTEIAHLELYDRSKKAVDQGGDASIDALYVCDYCGFTMEGDPPDKCPLCGNPKKNFVKF